LATVEARRPRMWSWASTIISFSVYAEKKQKKQKKKKKKKEKKKEKKKKKKKKKKAAKKKKKKSRERFFEGTGIFAAMSRQSRKSVAPALPAIAPPPEPRGAS
jgi:uncharacterized membrane protein YdbT with pleckstrin-like domain